MESPIPDKWRIAVVAVLRSGQNEKIITTTQSDLDWQAAFPDAWNYERFESMADALEVAGIVGRQVTTMSDPGDTYAFWFTFRRIKLYAKVNLSPTGEIIIIYSSHPPRKGISL